VKLATVFFRVLPNPRGAQLQTDTPGHPKWFVLVTALSLNIVARGQTVELVPTLSVLTGEEKPETRWMDLSTKSIVNLYAKGYWKSLDKTNPIAGFSVTT
jgi:hypothetical protein